MASLVEETLIQCPVCKEHYSLKEHRPKILPCDHTLCKTCIKKLGHTFQCPLCKSDIDTDDCVAMTTNFMALEFAETLPSEIDEGDSNANACIISGQLQSNLNSDDPDLTPTLERSDLLPNTTEDILKANRQYSSTDSSCHSHVPTLLISSHETIDSLELDLESKFSNAFDLTAKKMSLFEEDIKQLKASKDVALEDMDAELEHLVQLLHRRKQLLKNQLLTQYEEKLEELEEKMEKVTYTTMCLTSLQKHSELVFSDYNNEEMDPGESQGLKLLSNIERVETEIDELVEQLSDTEPLQRESFVYQSYGTSAVEREIRTVGRIKLQNVDEEKNHCEGVSH